MKNEMVHCGCGPSWNPPLPRPPRPVCPPDRCCCDRCREQECCDVGQGILLPRILAAGREWLRRQAVCLRVEGLPECARSPYTLVSVCAAGEPYWTQSQDTACRQLRLHVTIPLLCQVEDAAGCVHCGRAWAEVDTALRLPGQTSACWQGQMMFMPCVQLLCAACPVETPCFDAQLDVRLDTYLVRWEPCKGGMPDRPKCPPPLPLYPQPCR